MTIGRQAVEEITVNPKDALVSHEVMFTVNKTVANVYRIFLKMPLQAVLKRTDKLPGVDSTRMMKGDEFGDVGTRRLVRLTDEHTVVEEVIEGPAGAPLQYPGVELQPPGRQTDRVCHRTVLVLAPRIPAP